MPLRGHSSGAHLVVTPGKARLLLTSSGQRPRRSSRPAGLGWRPPSLPPRRPPNTQRPIQPQMHWCRAYRNLPGSSETSQHPSPLGNVFHLSWAFLPSYGVSRTEPQASSDQPGHLGGLPGRHLSAEPKAYISLLRNPLLVQSVRF